MRITPRRPKGSWSQRNVALVATLEEQGRMTDAGGAAVEAARADGRWDAAYARSGDPPGARRPGRGNRGGAGRAGDFDVLTSANRFALIHRVESMKRAESRARKITEMVDYVGARRDALPAEGGSPRTGRPGRRRSAVGSPMTKWEYLTAPILTHAAKQILDTSAPRAGSLVQINRQA